MAPRFDPKRLRLERVNTEWSYHAAYRFYGLKGAIAERWAHGPIFGAVTELGSVQLNLTPASDQPNADKLVAVVGIRASGLLGEGKERVAQAIELWPAWLEDVQVALNPLRSTRVGVDLFGMYPIQDEWRVTQRVKERYYSTEALDELAGTDTYHAGPEVFETDGRKRRTIQMGVVGPPHRGQYFAAENPDRDSRWWLGFRLNYHVVDAEGLDEPLLLLADVMDAALADWHRVSREVFPHLVM